MMKHYLRLREEYLSMKIEEAITDAKDKLRVYKKVVKRWNSIRLKSLFDQWQKWVSNCICFLIKNKKKKWKVVTQKRLVIEKQTKKKKMAL